MRKKLDLPFDVQKLPLPSVACEPTYAGWRAYLEAIREVAEAMHYAELTPEQRQMRALGMAGMVEGLEAPDLELAVPYEVYREKLAVAKTLAWNEEKKGARALGGDRPRHLEDLPAAEGQLKPTPALEAVLDEIQSKPEMRADPNLWVNPFKAEPETLKPTPTRSSVLDEVRKNPEFKYKPMATGEALDVDAWRNEVWQPQFDLWESQFKSEGPTPKAKLLLAFYLETILPLTAKKSHAVFPVLMALYLASPEDLRAFKLSNRRLAKASGAALRLVPTAVDQLVELGVLSAKKGLWSEKGPKAAVLPEYRLVPFEELGRRYQ